MNLDARKFLVDAGLREPGQRGRLSEKCKQTIDIAIAAGLTFSNWDEEKRTIIKVATEKKPRKTRDKSLVTAEKPKIDLGIVRGANAIRVTGRDGATHILDVHHACSRPINRCTCKPLHVQPWLQAEKIEFITINQ